MLRISTQTIFNNNANSLTVQQNKLMQTQQQISSGKKVSVASDDPVAATRAISVSQMDAITTQYNTNGNSAIASLNLLDSTQQSIDNVLQGIRANLLQASGSTLLFSDRQAIAQALQTSLENLKGLSNSTDAVGNYIFAGAQGKIVPFVNNGAGYIYQGDDTQLQIQVSSSRNISTNVSGADQFMRLKSGNGTFSTAVSAANTGSGTIDLGSLQNSSLWNGSAYKIDFTNIAGALNVTITNTTTGAVALATTPFNGQNLVFDGAQVNVKGNIIAGDGFTVSPSVNVSIFQTIADAVTNLSDPSYATNDVAKAKLQTNLNNVLGGVDSALNQNLKLRATVGARLSELDMWKTIHDTNLLQFKTELSNLIDIDYTQAISSLNLQQTALQAAQKSFANVTSLSLFNYIN